MTLAMTGGVGSLRANAPIDVAIVQDLLNRAEPGASPLDVDGLETMDLFDRIGSFQKGTMGRLHPDSAVDPGGPTYAALSKAASATPMSPKLDQGSESWPAWKTMGVAAFCSLYQRQFPEKTRPGLNVLTTYICSDSGIADIRWAAYMLATAWAESYDWVRNTRFEPVREVGHGRDHRVRDVLPVPPKDPLKFSAKDLSKASHSGTTYGYGDKITFVDAAGVEHPDNVYYGRGYAQITWWDRYLVLGNLTGRGEDFAKSPDTVLDPATAYNVMTYGMQNGSFTGVSLSHYIDKKKCDYYNARQIINGHDNATEIARVARQLELLLRINAG